MKILFAIQGTGNGHICRARDIYPELLKYGEVDVLISGIQTDLNVPFPVKYRMYGMSFIFGKSGGVDLFQTAKRLKLFRLLRDVINFPVEDYDLVINDFEPISAWACKRKGLPCISLSHQCAVLNEKAPRPESRDLMGSFILQQYAPSTAAYGFHYKAFADNIFTPVIRREIRELRPTDEGHYTVYLPAYRDEAIVKHLSQFKDVKWQVFSKHNQVPFISNNVSIRRIDNRAFIESMAASTGVLIGAGFQASAEAMYLNKKVLVIPMLTQYEQRCNAAVAKTMGATVIKTLNKKHYETIHDWIASGKKIAVDYPDMTAAIIEKIVHTHNTSIRAH